MAEDIYDSIHVTEIPTVVVTQVLSYLNWEDKLNTIKAIPQWRLCLNSSTAWPLVVYGQEAQENIYFLGEKRTKFLYCMKQFGKYIKSMHISFGYRIGQKGLRILHAILEFCSDLKVFHVKQDMPRTVDDGMIWRKTVVSAVCDIIQSSPSLRSVGIIQPFIYWTDSLENNIVLTLVKRKLADKVTHLELSPESLWEHEGLLEILSNFTGLTKLTIRREIINNGLLLNLVRCGLQELTLYQEEEIPLAQQGDLKTDFWTEVLKICSHFKLDLIFRYILVIKDSFPARMPLRSLILDDLVNIVTRGVVDHITDNYKDTLQHFTYANSFLENMETGDRRLPSALVDMVGKCSQLHTLQYGFPLSSTAVLLIAKSRKLKKLSIPLIEVSYEYDWPRDSGFSDDEIKYLKNHGRCEYTLEREVSRLLGFDWKLTDPFTLHEMSYLRM